MNIAHIKHFFIYTLVASMVCFLTMAANGQSTIYVCNEPPTDSGEFCKEDVSWVQTLDTIIEYDLAFGDSIGYTLEKTLYYIVTSNDFGAAPTATFVLKEVEDSEKTLTKS